jgi:hypothetical protein
VARDWSSVDLEAALADLGRQLDYPPTPDLSSQVRARLAHTRPQRFGWRMSSSVLRIALAGLIAAFVALGAVFLASPQARTVVAERLGVRGVLIDQMPHAPTPLPGAELDLGQPTTLADVRAQLPLLVPNSPGLRTPDGVYVAPNTTVALVYGARPGLTGGPETRVGLLILESQLPPSGFEPAVIRKSAGPDTRIEEVAVGGGRGVWLDGAPHVLFVPDANGQFREDRVRLAGNVLVWQQGPLLVRLEGALSKEQALEIAASMQ